MPKRNPLSDEEQRKRFEKAVRDAGVDIDDKTLERIVRRIAKPTPKPAKSSRKK